LGRVAWIQDPLADASESTPTLDDRRCLIKGRVSVDGRPAVGARLLWYQAHPRILAGGGYQSFLSALDTMYQNDFVPLPSEAAAGTCDHEGRFVIPVKPGGPYVMSLLYQQRAVNEITGVTMRMADSPWLTRELGWTFPADGEFDVGELAASTIGSPLPDRPVLDVPEYIQLGTHRRGQAWTSHLRIANLGTKPLTISAGKTDCGCSQLFADAKQTPLGFPLRIAPGGSLPVFIKVSTTPLFPRGRVSKRLLLTTDDPLRQAAMATMLFTLNDPFAMQPDVVQLDIQADQNAAQGEAFLTGAEDVTITKVDLPRPGMSVEILPGGRSLRVTATPAAFVDQQNSFRVEASIHLTGTTSGPITMPITMPIQGTILGRPAIRPSRLAFGEVRQGTRLKRHLTLTGVPADSVISQVTTTDKGITVLHATINGIQTELELEVTGPDSGNSRLSVTVKTPACTLTIPITWTLVATP